MLSLLIGGNNIFMPFLLFPNKQGTSGSGTGPEPGYNHCANVEHSSLVPQIATCTSFDRFSSYSSKGTKNTTPSFQS